jgi:UDP:flavonoid glycosyltransferase YjiC (YdhE family)
MAISFASVPGYGPFHPLVPLARALRAAGRHVAFATAEPFCSRGEGAGFAARPAGLTEEATAGAVVSGVVSPLRLGHANPLGCRL